VCMLHRRSSMSPLDHPVSVSFYHRCFFSHRVERIQHVRCSCRHIAGLLQHQIWNKTSKNRLKDVTKTHSVLILSVESGPNAANAGRRRADESGSGRSRSPSKKKSFPTCCSSRCLPAPSRVTAHGRLHHYNVFSPYPLEMGL
jgi:hypothetical protein